jgi:hypothetical protein
MARHKHHTTLTLPGLHLFRMSVFLVLAGLVALVMQKQILVAFWANPGLNGLIFLVLFLGIIFSYAQVARLFPEIRWANRHIEPGEMATKPDDPVMLAPMAALLNAESGRSGISVMTLRSVLDSLGGRLDESREIARYLIGLLVFLGLLGTFWGLIETVSSIGGVIEKLPSGGDNTALFDELKRSLAAPLAGMGIAFSSSLFGLAGSLILGFLDLQAGQAQSRFFYELEEWLSSQVQTQVQAGDVSLSMDMRDALDGVSRMVAQADQAASPSGQVLAHLAEGIQGLVQNMRAEQQMIRTWVEAQAAQQAEVKRLLEKLTRDAEASPNKDGENA